MILPLSFYKIHLYFYFAFRGLRFSKYSIKNTKRPKIGTYIFNSNLVVNRTMITSNKKYFIPSKYKVRQNEIPCIFSHHQLSPYLTYNGVYFIPKRFYPGPGHLPTILNALSKNKPPGNIPSNVPSSKPGSSLPSNTHSYFFPKNPSTKMIEPDPENFFNPPSSNSVAKPDTLPPPTPLPEKANTLNTIGKTWLNSIDKLWKYREKYENTPSSEILPESAALLKDTENNVQNILNGLHSLGLVQYQELNDIAGYNNKDLGQTKWTPEGSKVYQENHNEHIRSGSFLQRLENIPVYEIGLLNACPNTTIFLDGVHTHYIVYFEDPNLKLNVALGYFTSQTTETIKIDGKQQLSGNSSKAQYFMAFKNPLLFHKNDLEDFAKNINNPVLLQKIITLPQLTLYNNFFIQQHSTLVHRELFLYDKENPTIEDLKHMYHNRLAEQRYYLEREDKFTAKHLADMDTDVRKRMALERKQYTSDLYYQYMAESIKKELIKRAEESITAKEKKALNFHGQTNKKHQNDY